MRLRAPSLALVLAVAAILGIGCESSVAVDPILGIAISPTSDTLHVGEARQLAANVVSNGPQSAAAPSPTWSSSNPASVSVNPTGMVSGVAAGVAIIHAVVGDKQDSTPVFVLPASAPPPPPPPPPPAGGGGSSDPTVAAVQVSAPATGIVAGTTLQLTAAVLDSAGHAVTGAAVVWAASTPAVATVSATGLVTAVASGTTLITATSGAKMGTVTVTVLQNVCAPTGSGICRYVDGTAGNDANPGTAAQAYRTLAKAVSVVNPGDMVIVRDGIYTGGSGAVLAITRGGTSANLVVFKAEHQWGAVLDGQNNTSSTGVQYAASYVRVEGFEVRGVNHYGFDMGVGFTGIQAAGNNIHDVGHYCTSTTSGLSAFGVDDDNVLIEQNVIHDIGRYAAGENGCTPSNAYYQNHDHGIYLSSGSNITVRNNLFYNIKHGWALQRYNTGGAPATGLYVVNNTFVFPNPYRDGHIIIDCPLSNSVIADNIFYQPTTAGIWFNSGPMSNVSISNNLTYGGVISTGSSAGATLANNMDNRDPLLRNPSGLDFHLKAGSPAIAAGLWLSSVTNDFAGMLRTAGTDDLGAYRY